MFFDDLCLYLFFYQFAKLDKSTFRLGTKSTDANSLYFTMFSIDRSGGFLNFLGSVLSLKIVFIPRFFAKKSRYRKKLPAAAANQIAGNQKISLGMHK